VELVNELSKLSVFAPKNVFWFPALVKPARTPTAVFKELFVLAVPPIAKDPMETFEEPVALFCNDAVPKATLFFPVVFRISEFVPIEILLNPVELFREEFAPTAVLFFPVTPSVTLRAFQPNAELYDFVSVLFCNAPVPNLVFVSDII
jgi:hypothetical protein